MIVDNLVEQLERQLEHAACVERDCAGQADRKSACLRAREVFELAEILARIDAPQAHARGQLVVLDRDLHHRPCRRVGGRVAPAARFVQHDIERRRRRAGEIDRRRLGIAEIGLDSLRRSDLPRDPSRVRVRQPLEERDGAKERSQGIRFIGHDQLDMLRGWTSGAIGRCAPDAAIILDRAGSVC